MLQVDHPDHQLADAALLVQAPKSRVVSFPPAGAEQHRPLPAARDGPVEPAALRGLMLREAARILGEQRGKIIGVQIPLRVALLPALRKVAEGAVGLFVAQARPAAVRPEAVVAAVKAAQILLTGQRLLKRNRPAVVKAQPGRGVDRAAIVCLRHRQLQRIVADRRCDKIGQLAAVLQPAKRVAHQQLSAGHRAKPRPQHADRMSADLPFCKVAIKIHLGRQLLPQLHPAAHPFPLWHHRPVPPFHPMLKAPPDGAAAPLLSALL